MSSKRTFIWSNDSEHTRVVRVWAKIPTEKHARIIDAVLVRICSSLIMLATSDDDTAIPYIYTIDDDNDGSVEIYLYNTRTVELTVEETVNKSDDQGIIFQYQNTTDQPMIVRVLTRRGAKDTVQFGSEVAVRPRDFVRMLPKSARFHDSFWDYDNKRLHWTEIVLGGTESVIVSVITEEEERNYNARKSTRPL